jgi:hypothetical protein
MSKNDDKGLLSELQKDREGFRFVLAAAFLFKLVPTVGPASVDLICADVLAKVAFELAESFLREAEERSCT